MTEPPKIDILLPWEPMDGIKEYWLRINKHLKKYIRTDIVKNNRPRSMNPIYFIKLAKKSKNSDIVHVQHNYCLFGSLFHKFNSTWAWLYYFSLKIYGVPKIVTTIHDVVEPNNLNLYKRVYLEFMNFPLKFLSDKIIIHNEHTAKQLIRQGFDSKKLAIIPNGVEDIKINSPKRSIMKKFKIPNKKTLILFGWIRADKQYERAIYALKDLPEVQIVIIGGAREEDKNYLNFLKNEIEKLDLGSRVIFTGSVNEVEKFELISCGDIAIFPYSRISNSAALMDAISVHVPCITSNIPEFKELNEKWGVIKTINVNSSKDLINEIKLTLKSSDEIKNRIEKYILKNNGDVVSEKIKKVYEEVLS